MKIRVLLSVLIMSLVAAACGDASETASDIAEGVVEVVEEAVDETMEENAGILSGDEDSTDEDAVEEDPVEEDAVDEDVDTTTTEVDGQALYEANCTRCHGADGSGGRGPSLQGIAVEQPDQSNGIDQTTNGGDGMPAFGERLSEEEIQAMIDYIWDTF